MTGGIARLIETLITVTASAISLVSGSYVWIRAYIKLTSLQTRERATAIHKNQKLRSEGIALIKDRGLLFITSRLRQPVPSQLKKALVNKPETVNKRGIEEGIPKPNERKRSPGSPAYSQRRHMQKEEEENRKVSLTYLSRA